MQARMGRVFTVEEGGEEDWFGGELERVCAVQGSSDGRIGRFQNGRGWTKSTC